MNLSDFSHERLLRAGLLLGAFAAVLVALAGLFDLAEGAARRHGGIVVLSVEPIVPLIGISAAALIVTTTFVPLLWPRLVGILATTAVATTAGVEGLRARVSGDFAPDERTALLAGGILLVVAFWLALVAVALTLLGLRQIAQDRDRFPDEVLAAMPVRPDGRPWRTPLTGTLGVALGLVGLIAPVVSGLAAALSLTALGDIRAYDGRMGGRSTAITGVVLGIAGLSLMLAVLGVSPFFLTPRA